MGRRVQNPGSLDGAGGIKSYIVRNWERSVDLHLMSMSYFNPNWFIQFTLGKQVTNYNSVSGEQLVNMFRV